MQSRGRVGRWSVAWLVSLTFACSEFPTDPKHTSERVAQTGVLRVGVTEHAPWVEKSASARPAGVEVQIVEKLAAEQRARVQWLWGQQEALFAALENFELDLVIGGIDEKTPWSDRIGLTAPWYEQRWGVAVPPGSSETSLEELAVAVAPGTVAARELARIGARPIRTRDFRQHGGAIAAPLEALKVRKMTIIEPKLHTVRLVFAVGPGENGWLVKVERFLAAHRQEFERLADGAPQ